MNEPSFALKSRMKSREINTRHSSEPRTGATQAGVPASSRRSPATHKAPDNLALSRLSGFLQSHPSGEHVASASSVGGLDDSTGRARVHRSDEASSVLSSFGSPGLTLGRHILIDPHLPAAFEKRVLSHELAHVAQSRAAEPDLNLPIELGQRGSPEELRANQGGLDGAFSSPNVVRRWDADYRFDDSGDDYAAAYEAARQLRERWETSMSATWQSELGRQTRSLGEDIEATEDMIIQQRAALFAQVQARPGSDLPYDLMEKWGRARQAAEVVSFALRDSVISPEVSESSRPQFSSYYWSLHQVLERNERSAAEREEMMRPSTTFRQTTNCPRSCHQLTQSPDLRFQFVAPPPLTPRVQEIIRSVDSAESWNQWTQVLGEFKWATKRLDEILINRTQRDSEARLGFEYATALADRQRLVERTHPDAVKIKAVFYPETEFVEVLNEDGTRKEVAKAIPWQFYLYHTGTSDPFATPHANIEWVLMDVTSPTPNDFKANKTEELSPLRGALAQQGMAMNPPIELFSALNSKLRFPKGKLFWQMPERDYWSLVTEASWDLSDWLQAIGIGLAALGLILATAGAGTPAAVAFIAASAVGIMATVEDLNEKAAHGMLTQEDLDRAVLYIALDIAGALTAGLGVVSKVTAAARGVGRLATASGKLWFIAQSIETSLTAVNLGLVTSDLIKQYELIQNQPGLSEKDRDKALGRLIRIGLFTGGLSMLALHGGMKDMASSLTPGARIHIDVDAQGNPRVFNEGEAAQGGRGLTVDAAPVTLRVAADAPTAPRRMGFLAPEVGAPRVDGTLHSRQVVIDYSRGPNGLVDHIEVKHAADAPKFDIDVHLRAAELLRTYGGFVGRIRKAIRDLRRAVTGTEEPPLHLQIELWKLQESIRVREQKILGRRVRDGVVRDLEDEITRIRKQLEDVEAAIKDPSLRAAYPEGRVALESRPDATFAPPPHGHIYYLSDGKWRLRRRAGYSGPRFQVEYDQAGAPTGRVTNTQELLDSGVIGQALNPTTTAQLTALGYTVDSMGRISRKRSYTGGIDEPYMEPLRVTPLDGIQIHATESFAEGQAQLRRALKPAQQTKFDALVAKAATTTDQVVLVRGLHDTGVRWRDVLTAAQELELRQGLVSRGVPQATADRLVNQLLARTDTLKVVIGTESFRQFDYRSLLEQSGITVAPRTPVHHFDPLYLGGGHEMLIQLPTDTHDWVHHFFDELRLPATANPPGVRLQPTELQNSVRPVVRPAAVVTSPTGSVQLVFL